jgi:hypothetical protein
MPLVCKCIPDFEGRVMRKSLWAVQLGNGNLVHYQYCDHDLKVALFTTKRKAEVWLEDQAFWRSRSAKVVKVVVKIETF